MEEISSTSTIVTDQLKQIKDFKYAVNDETKNSKVSLIDRIIVFRMVILIIFAIINFVYKIK